MQRLTDTILKMIASNDAIIIINKQKRDQEIEFEIGYSRKNRFLDIHKVPSHLDTRRFKAIIDLSNLSASLINRMV